MAIRISPEDMDQRSQQFGGHGDMIEQINGELDRLLDQLQEEWEGQASSSFHDQYEQLKPSFLQMRELLADLSGQLKETANIMRETDLEISKKFGVK